MKPNLVNPPNRLADEAALLAHLEQRLLNSDVERALGGFTLLHIVLIGAPETGAPETFGAAEALRSALRDTDVLATLGRGEFAVVLPQMSDHETSLRVAEKLLAAPIGISHIGVAHFPADGQQAGELTKKARLAAAAVKPGMIERVAYAATHDRLID